MWCYRVSAKGWLELVVCTLPSAYLSLLLWHVSFSQLCQPAAPTVPITADLFNLGAAVSSTEASVCGEGHPRWSTSSVSDGICKLSQTLAPLKFKLLLRFWRMFCWILYAHWGPIAPVLITGVMPPVRWGDIKPSDGMSLTMPLDLGLVRRWRHHKCCLTMEYLLATIQLHPL